MLEKVKGLIPKNLSRFSGGSMEVKDTMLGLYYRASIASIDFGQFHIWATLTNIERNTGTPQKPNEAWTADTTIGERQGFPVYGFFEKEDGSTELFFRFKSDSLITLRPNANYKATSVLSAPWKSPEGTAQPPDPPAAPVEPDAWFGSTTNSDDTSTSPFDSETPPTAVPAAAAPDVPDATPPVATPAPTRPPSPRPPALPRSTASGSSELPVRSPLMPPRPSPFARPPKPPTFDVEATASPKESK